MQTASSIPSETTATSAAPAVAAATASSAAASAEDVADLPRLERWKRAIKALRTVLADPDRTDQVLEFLTVVNGGGKAHERRLARFFSDPAGAALYDEHRAIDSRTDLAALAALPEGTLGHAYATFLKGHGLTPEIFDGSPAGITEPRRSYIVQRMRQTHDLWHVVTGCETDPASEVALQAFTFAQVRTPGNALLALFGALRIMRERPGVVRDAIALYRAGKRANWLPVFAWEDHWATPLAEVRVMLGLPVRPVRRAAN
jgi:ubiquinone biosynthesis protein COQ4